MKIAAALQTLAGLRKTTPAWKKVLDVLEAPLQMETGVCWILDYRRRFPDQSVRKYSLGPFKTKAAANLRVIDEYYSLSRVYYLKMGDIIFLNNREIGMDLDLIKADNDCTLAIFDGFVEDRPDGGFAKLPHELKCE